MKRLIVFILLTLLLCGINMSFADNLTIEKIFPNASVEVFVGQKTDLDYKKIDNGKGEILFCQTSDLNYILSKVNIAGLTIKINSTDRSGVLKKLNAQKVYGENFGDYGWSSALQPLNKMIKLNGTITNFQCVVSNSSVIVGVPVILGCY